VQAQPQGWPLETAQAPGRELQGAGARSAWGQPAYPTLGSGAAYADGLNTVSSGAGGATWAGGRAGPGSRQGGSGDGGRGGLDSPAPLQRHGSQALSTTSAADSPRSQLLGRSGLFKANKVLHHVLVTLVIHAQLSHCSSHPTSHARLMCTMATSCIWYCTVLPPAGLSRQD
jgi:hypothetical protein